MPITTTVTVIQGDTANIVVQCRYRGANDPAAYSSADVLSASVWQLGATAATFTCSTVAWYTAGGNQTGFDEGQAVAGMSNANMLLLMPCLTYILRVSRAIGGNMADIEEIGRIKLAVEAPA